MPRLFQMEELLPHLPGTFSARLSSRVRGWIAYGAAWVVAAGVWAMASAFSARMSPLETLPYGLLIMSVAGVMGVAIWRITGRVHWRRARSSFFGVHAVALSVYALGYAVSLVIPDLARGNLTAAITGLNTPVLPWSILMGSWLYLMVAGISYAIRTERERERQAAAAAEARLLAQRAQLSALRAQLNPHFLFNALHTISALVTHDPAAADRALDRLGDLLRYAMADEEMVPLAAEWAFLRDYLAFEQLRWAIVCRSSIDSTRQRPMPCSRRSSFSRSSRMRAPRRLASCGRRNGSGRGRDTRADARRTRLGWRRRECNRRHPRRRARAWIGAPACVGEIWRRWGPSDRSFPRRVRRNLEDPGRMTTSRSSSQPTVTALVVDDEPLARRKVRELLREVAWMECLGEVDDGLSALRAIDELQPDLVFLDIRMPGVSGLEILRRVRHVPAVIFTTAYDRYAVTAFELAAVDYLLKPFSRDRFLQSLERARPALESRLGASALERAEETLRGVRMRRLFVRESGRILPLRASGVERLEACDDFSYVYAGGRRYRVNAPLTALEQRLYPAQFVRIHRSHIVNLDYVAAWAPYDGSRYEVRLRDGTVLTASRQRSRALRELAR